MGFLDRFNYRQQPASGKDAELLSDAQASSSSTSELLSNEEVHAPPSTGNPLSQLGDGGRLYNPYEGLSAAVDGRGLKGGFRLPQQPEFLFDEQATVHKRTWSENLTYYTGTGYLSGAVLGGSQGVLAALRTKPEHGSDTLRLRINRFLNLSGKSGRAAGNALGVLGFFFASLESGYGYLADGRLPDAAESIAAGFTTGAIYRSTRGLRAAGVAGAVGATAAAALVGARNVLNKNL